MRRFPWPGVLTLAAKRLQSLQAERRCSAFSFHMGHGLIAMKIAVLGTGISGLVAAYLLHRQHDLTVFEANDYVGGHTNTIKVETENGPVFVDAGFIVHNDWTYPNFIRLLETLGVETRPTSMSFSVTSAQTGLEYSSASINCQFAQRRNFLRPSFYRLLLDILRFNREALSLLEDSVNDTLTVGEYLRQRGWSQSFRDHYLVPMAGAIWSASPKQLEQFPIRFILEFYRNHGMLNVFKRPQWRVIAGGSYRYVEALTAGFRDRIRLRCPVHGIRRTGDGVLVQPREGREERFDHVIVACHADQALRLLRDPSALEQDLLSAFPYQRNEAVLHTDTSLLPRNRRAWASWNYRVPKEDQSAVAVTYNMNILQGLQTPDVYCVTLNETSAIDPIRIVRRITYHHPTYNARQAEAQRRHQEVINVRRTSYCGAYWGYGFHEDGVRSALEVCKQFGATL